MLKELRKAVYEANQSLVKNHLVVLTWGNASGIDREKGLIVIKPSGVPYETMTPDDLVIVNLDGKVIEGKLRPSVDLPTHLELYRNFPTIQGVVHDHSPYATAFAQAQKNIPSYGTTQADYCQGSIPCARSLSQQEIAKNYEKNTAKVLIEAFVGKDPASSPGCLAANHGVFAWGTSVKEAAENALIIEECARLALLSQLVDPTIRTINPELAALHYSRKHGKNHPYGQGDKQ